MTADRDDLDAILAKHRFRQMDGEQAECVYGDWTQDEDDYRTDPHEAHRTHVAQMVLESEWLRDVKAQAWDECIKPFRHYGFTNRNPYRADRVDAEDGGR